MNGIVGRSFRSRGAIALPAAGIAGVLVWLATQISDNSTGGYWAVYGLIASAGLMMGLSQVLGGWTKCGLPRPSLDVLVLAFIPTLLAAGWVVLWAQPQGNWFRDHIRSWSDDLSVDGLVSDLSAYVAVLAFGTGLVFGFTFDTTVPFVRRWAAFLRATGTEPESAPGWRQEVPVPADAARDRAEH